MRTHTHTLVCPITLKAITLSCSPFIITSDPLKSHFRLSFMFIKASYSSASLLSFPSSLSLSLPSTLAFFLCALIHWGYLFVLFFFLLLILSFYASWRPAAFREQGYSQSFVSSGHEWASQDNDEELRCAGVPASNNDRTADNFLPRTQTSCFCKEL